MLAIVLTLFVCGAFANPIDSIDQSRIIGGQPAYTGQFPYQVSLRYTNNAEHFCGGSIISGFFILTSADCAVRVTPTQVRVVVGTNYLNSGGEFYSVDYIHSHANFNPSTMVNDIAILKLTQQLSGSPTINSVSLASGGTPSGERAVLSGWGYTSHPTGRFSNELQYIYLQTISVQQCQTIFPMRPIFDSNLCTFMVSGMGPCTGDSGSPLVLNGLQHGIVSWGNPCAKGDPDIFTSIPFYRSWIRSVTGI